MLITSTDMSSGLDWRSHRSPEPVPGGYGNVDGMKQTCIKSCLNGLALCR